MEDGEAMRRLHSRRQRAERKLLEVVRLLRRLRWSFETLFLAWTGAAHYTRDFKIRNKTYATPGMRRKAVYRALRDPRYQALQEQANEPQARHVAAGDIMGELDGLMKLPYFGQFDRPIRPSELYGYVRL